MSEEFEVKPPTWFWIVSILGLLWNVAGVIAFVTEMMMDLSSLPDAQRLFFEQRPLWATAGYAAAVFGGVLGCLALLLRKSWAVLMLIICLVGIVLQIFHSFALGNGLNIFGPEGLILPVMVFGIACFLTWFASMSRNRGWLK